MAMDWAFLSVALCALFCSAAMQDTLRDEQGWTLLKEIEFSPGMPIEFNYTVTLPVSYSPTNLLFYQEDQYQEAMASSGSKTCAEKRAILQEAPAVSAQTQVLQYNNVNCTPTYDVNMGDALRCEGVISFPGVQQRKWYIVVNRCGSLNNINGVDIRYLVDKVMMTTTQPPTRPTMTFFPSGQSEVTYSTFTLVLLLMLKQCIG